MPKHPSHETRFSYDASTYDEVCVHCGATDMVPGGWGELAHPCLGKTMPPVLPEAQRFRDGYDLIFGKERQ